MLPPVRRESVDSVQLRFAPRALPESGVFPEYVPLPSAKEIEFYSGLKRGSLNLLVLSCKANGFRPPVKSVSLRRPGCMKGKRLILLASLLGYLRTLQVEQTSSTGYRG